MASRHTGSDELIYIQTDRICVTIKGEASHPAFHGEEIKDTDSAIKIVCNDPYELSVRGRISSNASVTSGIFDYSGSYPVQPMFYEQQDYEIIVELLDADNLHSISFWHDNLNIRNKISPVGRNQKILSGIINFKNEIGFSDLMIRLDGQNYLLLTLEVFPTKISYQEDYQAIMEDITKEVYNLVFDFLKKTYLGYRQNDRTSASPVEFFSVIRKIYGDFLRAADMILARPHHLLETSREVLPSYKVKRLDSRSVRWLQKHPEQACRKDGRILATKTMAVKKQVTYDTKENRLTKYILQTTVRKLESFKSNYCRLFRNEDPAVIDEIDAMIRGLNRRCNTSFLKDVHADTFSTGMSLVFSMAPGYRDLYKYYLMLLHGLSISGDVFHMSVKDLAVLYEYWCFIKLNSLMKEKYELVSQDVIKVQGNGLFVTLVKGQGSNVKYCNPRTGEHIILSYNPKTITLPTVSQRPDNVLTLEKRGTDTQYKYIFDAKYRLNPALPGTDYYDTISQTPGPMEDDINTMHRYRDAIVYSNNISPYERTMFGAYVLFPLRDEEQYKNHRFYRSIEQVNIGGLPFLPSATSLVSEMLDALVADSSESAFERTTLPKGIEEKLAKVDWSKRDVLVGSLRNAEQLDLCLRYHFYHVPARYVQETDFPIHYIALSQSINLFGPKDAGVSYYGEVTYTKKVHRKEITEVPTIGNPDEWYYRFEIKEWQKLSRPILQKEIGIRKPLFTNIFLLEHSFQVPELTLRTEEEYRLYSELKRTLDSTTINDDDAEHGFWFGKNLLMFESGKIHVYRDGRLCGKYDIKEFSRTPSIVFRRIRKEIDMS